MARIEYLPIIDQNKNNRILLNIMTAWPDDCLIYEKILSILPSMDDLALSNFLEQLNNRHREHNNPRYHKH